MISHQKSLLHKISIQIVGEVIVLHSFITSSINTIYSLKNRNQFYLHGSSIIICIRTPVKQALNCHVHFFVGLLYGTTCHVTKSLAKLAVS